MPQWRRVDFHCQIERICILSCKHPEFVSQQMSRCCSIHIITYSECLALGSGSQSTYEKSVSSAVLIVTMTTHAVRGVKSANLVTGPSPSGPFLKSSKHCWAARLKFFPLLLNISRSTTSARTGIVTTCQSIHSFSAKLKEHFYSKIKDLKE